MQIIIRDLIEKVVDHKGSDQSFVKAEDTDAYKENLWPTKKSKSVQWLEELFSVSFVG